MSDRAVPEQLLAFMKSLASETRLRILLAFLDGREHTVNEVAELVGLGQSTASEHLAHMKRAGLLVSRKEVRQVFYRPERARIVKMIKLLSELVRSCCTAC